LIIATLNVKTGTNNNSFTQGIIKMECVCLAKNARCRMVELKVSIIQ